MIVGNFPHVFPTLHSSWLNEIKPLVDNGFVFLLACFLCSFSYSFIRHTLQWAVERSVFLLPGPFPDCWWQRCEQDRRGEDDDFWNGKAPLHRWGHCKKWSLPLLGNPHPEAKLSHCARWASGHDPRIRSHNEAQTLPPESKNANKEGAMKLFRINIVWLNRWCKLTLKLYESWSCQESVKEAFFTECMALDATVYQRS